MMPRWQGCLLLAVFAVSLCGQLGVAAQSRARVYEVDLVHGVTPPAAGLVRRAVHEATAANAAALIVKVEGGGTVLRTAWTLARDLNAAAVPIVVYVGPGLVAGGPAATLLLAASDVAVMAPGATAGFAEPLATTPEGFTLQTQRLLVDDVAHDLTGWQQAHGRNTEWVDRAARVGAITDAEGARALNPPLIDAIATDDELLVAIQGRKVLAADGTAHTLDVLGASTTVVAPTTLEWLTQLLAIPTIAFVLFVLGVIAIYLELASPGASVPGVAGVALVIAALYGFFQTDVRPLAVVLLTAGLILAGLEHIVMAHGGLTLGGIILLVLGALLLVDPTRTPGMSVAPLAIVGTSGLLVLAVVGMVALALRVHRREPATGPAALIGQIAEVRRSIDPEGLVFVAGALWQAWSDDGPLAEGELVEVAAIDDLRLYVRRFSGSDVSLQT
jgi:membrane-bound serine protease (ClpP class)